MVELRTKQEIQRDKLHETICGQYNEFRQLMPNATPTRIFTAIAQLHQELFYSIRIGKLGFSGDVMRDAYQYYAGEVTNEQRFIERALTGLFKHWHDALLQYADLSIQPLKYISAEQNG